MKVGIIIPVRREEQNIVRTLTEISSRTKINHTIYVVDDSVDATDKTPAVVAKYSRTHKQVRLIRKQKKDPSGFAPALFRGLVAAREPYILFVMADCCDEPETIAAMTEKMQEGYHVVCGSRYMRGGKKSGGPAVQNFFSTLVNLTLKCIANLPTHDATNSFKLINRQVLLKHYREMYSPGFEISLEILLRLYFHGYRIAEVPTHWRGRTIGLSKFKIAERTPKYGRLYLFALSKQLEKITRPSSAS